MLDKAELLLPAGSLVKLKTAILYGADAVYAGTPDMCLRAQSKMTLEDLEEGIRFVHQNGKKIYLTLNLFMHNRDVAKLPQFGSSSPFSSRSSVMFLNLIMVNGLQSFPIRVCRKRTGRPTSKSVMRAMIPMTGRAITRPKLQMTMSRMRFPQRV